MASKAELRKSYIDSIYSTLGTVTVFAVVGIAVALFKGRPEGDTAQAQQAANVVAEQRAAYSLPAPAQTPLSASQGFTCSNRQTLG